ncbi:phosphonate transport system substrate-binding protein [Azospirillum oryzae]|uniref:Phosphonate transport system substrate-binding protein n=1 Tax=Azospirillum oryzae TaxID=286727 RepID=A0A1X7HL63_9PROT|nr:phosphonate transport system substrate-binding protein [Azospirillum oryzae]
MPRGEKPQHGSLLQWSRRSFLLGLGAASLVSMPSLAAPPLTAPVRFGLTPVFLDSDTDLLAALERYLETRLSRPVSLVKRRSYQEITTMLLTGQLDAAWICGFPYIQFRSQLGLVAVPVYRKQPLYQSYVIVQNSDLAVTIDDLRGQVHAFSDPDSNSGFLVTRYLLATMNESPASFFRRSFFTYGHRNVVRAVASGLAQSGSVDGYVWDVMAEIEPDLVGRTRVCHRSVQLGFPPIACQASKLGTPLVRELRAALVDMQTDTVGQSVLHQLRLDGFAVGEPSLFDGIAAMSDFVRAPA